MKTSAKYFGLAVGPRPGNMSQNDFRTTSLMTSLTKNLQSPTKNFFSSADCKTGLSVWVLEQLSSAISSGSMALVRQPKTAGFWQKSRYDIFVERLSKCEKYLCKLQRYINLNIHQSFNIKFVCHDGMNI